MAERQSGGSIGVLDGVLYAVRGENASGALSSVEAYRPSTGVWTPVSNMHQCRVFAGVVALDGLLYAVGGVNDGFCRLDSVEVYDPNTDPQSMLTVSMNSGRNYVTACVVDKPTKNYFVSHDYYKLQCSQFNKSN